MIHSHYIRRCRSKCFPAEAVFVECPVIWLAVTALVAACAYLVGVVWLTNRGTGTCDPGPTETPTVASCAQWQRAFELVICTRCAVPHWGRCEACTVTTATVLTCAQAAEVAQAIWRLPNERTDEPSRDRPR
jgi:hypothetical protein